MPKLAHCAPKGSFLVALALGLGLACTVEDDSVQDLGQLDPSGKDDSLGSFEVSVPPNDFRRLEFRSAAFGYYVDIDADQPFTMDLWNIDLPAAKKFFTREPATQASIEATPGNTARPGESHRYLLTLNNESDEPLTANVSLSSMAYDPCIHDEHTYTSVSAEEKLARCTEVVGVGKGEVRVSDAKFCVTRGELLERGLYLEAGDRYTAIDGYYKGQRNGYELSERVESPTFFAFSADEGSFVREDESAIESESEATSLEGKVYYRYDKDAQTLRVVQSVKKEGLFGLLSSWKPIFDVTLQCERVEADAQ